MLLKNVEIVVLVLEHEDALSFPLKVSSEKSDNTTILIKMSRQFDKKDGLKGYPDLLDVVTHAEDH